MLYAGQILRQPCDLGAVAENSDRAFDLPVAPERHAVGYDRNVLDGFQTDVVLAFSGLHDARDGRTRIDRPERLSERITRADAEDVRRRTVDIGDRAVRINGQQALVERVEDIHALQKQLTERIRLIAEQFLLDMIGEAHAEQTADTEREQGDQTVEQQHAQHRPAIGAQIQTRHYDAERLSVFIAHHGVGAAVGALRHLIAGKQRYLLTVQAADRIGPQGRQHGRLSFTGGEIVEYQRSALYVIYAEHIHRGDAPDGTFEILLCGIGLDRIRQERRVGRHLRGVGQQLIACVHILIQADAEPDRRREQHHDGDALDQHPAHTPVQRAG